MKKCPICGKEIDENLPFCPHCGAQVKSDKESLTWGEKRQQRERVNQQNIEKSYLHQDEIVGLEYVPHDQITLKAKGKTQKEWQKNVIWICVATLIVLVGFALFFVFKKFEFNKTLKVFLVLAVFLFEAFALSKIVECVYAVRMLSAMKKSNFAIKKIEYGKPPKVNIDGDLYEILVNTGCPECLCPTRHIEELDGKFVVVCDQNRTHLMLLDTTAFNPHSKEEQTSQDEEIQEVTAQVDESEDKESVEGGKIVESNEQSAENVEQ